MADYLLKSKILKERVNLDLYNKARKIIYRYVFKDDVSEKEYSIANDTMAFLKKRSKEEFKEYERISHAKAERNVRLKKKVFDMIFGSDCLFLTLTFTDKRLNATSAESRRYYVKQFLRQFNVPYVANIDFGKRNHREHYHALLQIDKIDYHLWKYGAINGKKVRNDIQFDEDGVITSESVERIARYISKLTNHAIKETTKRCAIMYSRTKKNKDDKNL